MSKELFMAAHERLIEAYLEGHLEASWEEAYERTVDMAYRAMADNLADMIDTARQREKDSRT